MDRYARIAQFVKDQPWAIMPEKLAVILDLLAFRRAGGRLTDQQIRDRVGADEADRYEGHLCEALSGSIVATIAAGTPLAAATAGRRAGSVVAVLGVYGTITQRADMLSEMSGATSTERFAARFREALADPAVRAVVLDVDSPGGGVYGVEELATEIRQARGRKPIAAIANSLAASAGYWIASAAEELSVTPSGEVGSIGVYAAHEDLSGLLEQEGVKLTLISAGKFKTEGNPWEPLSDEAREFIQGRVDDYHRAFVRDVAKGRGVSVETVRADFGQGRVVGAKAAKDAGMVDFVETLDDVVKRVAGRGGQGGSNARRAAQAAVQRAAL